MLRAVLEDLGQAGGHEVERDRRAGEHRDAAAKAPPRDGHLVLDVRGEVLGVRHRARIIAAAGDGTATG